MRSMTLTCNTQIIDHIRKYNSVTQDCCVTQKYPIY